MKQVGRELGVRYVLEGSVRKVRDPVRVTGQLIDASTGAHLRAAQFEGGLEDIFDLQDDITLRVVGAIAPKLEQVEIIRAMRKPTESLDGYDYYLRAMSNFHKGGREDISEALRLFRRGNRIRQRNFLLRMEWPHGAMFDAERTAGLTKDRPNSLKRRRSRHGPPNAGQGRRRRSRDQRNRNWLHV